MAIGDYRTCDVCSGKAFYDQAAEIARLSAKLEAATGALERIQEWAAAYPVEVFQEPDMKRAHELLTAGGITLDCVAASIIRRVLEGMQATAREGLEGLGHA